VSWNLKYQNNTSHNFPILQKDFGIGNKKNISWQVFMPSAKVTGNIIVNGKNHRINAEGYFDGNWGKWLMYDLRWNWLQFSSNRKKDSNFVVAVGDLVGLNTGKVMVISNGKKLIFDRQADDISIEQRKWKKNADPSYPTEIIVTAENKKYKLDVDVRVTLIDDIIKKNQFPIPDTYIIEENTICNAKLYEKKTGGLKLVNEYSGPGFSEYTTETYTRERQFLRKILGRAVKTDNSNICVR
jgi:predicted secreted hydrolase